MLHVNAQSTISLLQSIWPKFWSQKVVMFKRSWIVWMYNGFKKVFLFQYLFDFQLVLHLTSLKSQIFT